MHVLGLLSRKGGTGKTTLALHLAVLAQQAGRKTLLVDLDPQRSATGWWRVRAAKTPLLLETTGDRLGEMLDAARAEGIDLAVVDTRSLAATDAAQVAALADLALIPTRPGILDLRAILDTLDTVKGSAKRALIVLNACLPPRGTTEAIDTGDARRALAAFGVPVAPVAIVNRTRFTTALRAGLTACEADPTGKAAKEMNALWRVVEKELAHETTR
jgi:chromosome partitioning protein